MSATSYADPRAGIGWLNHPEPKDADRKKRRSALRLLTNPFQVVLICSVQMSSSPSARAPWYRGPNRGSWGLLASLALVVLGYLAYEQFGEPAKIREAKHAIEITVQACEDGYAPEYYRRLSEARDAINQVESVLGPDAEEQQMLTTGLYNQQIAVGCQPPE